MKKTLITFAWVLFAACSMAAMNQDTLPPNFRATHEGKVSVYLNSGFRKYITGRLVYVGDSSIRLATNTSDFWKGDTVTIPVVEMDKIIIRKKWGNRIGVGLSVAGVLLALRSYFQSEPPRSDSLITDIFLGVSYELAKVAGIAIGAIVFLFGALIALISRKKIIIKGDPEKYRRWRDKIVKPRR